MKILKIKRTMIEKGIPAEVIEQFIFPETEDETPEEKVAFADQMDKLLTKEQILSIMEEQGCSKDEHPEIWMKLKGKPIEESIDILNTMSINEYPRSRINEDGTLSVYWDFKENNKYKCVCPVISKLSKPAAVSLTYCGCCSGHVKYHSENSLGVKLRLIETVSSPINSNGEKYCEHRFEIISHETSLKEYKTKHEELKKVSEEAMRFMRGKYVLDEIGNGKDELAFLDGDLTILTIYIRDGYYNFAVGQEIMRVADIDALEKAKELIISAKSPNRKPLPRTHVHISNCGHRCDLCIHNKGEISISPEEMEYARACVSSVYTVPAGDLQINCSGCHFPNCTVESADCRKGKGIEKCWDCDNYPTCLKTAGWPPEIHTRTITADQVTWAILPYVKGQYGN